MKRTISWLALLVALGACRSENAGETSRSSQMADSGAEHNKRTVRRIYEEYINQNRRELLPELLADDYLGPNGARGPAAFSAIIDGLKRGVPDIRFNVEDLVAEGNRVAIRWTWSGHHTGPLNEFAASHRQVKNDGIAIYELRDGKVVRAWLQTDRLGFLQQIGVVPETLGRAPGRN